MLDLKENKKIVFFDGTLREGGAERVISILTREMANNDVPVEIVLYYDEEVFYTLHPNVKVTSVYKQTGKKSLIKNIFWLRKYFKNNAGMVVSFLAPFNMVAIVARMGSKIPIIVADRSDPSFSPANKWVRKLRNFLYRFADLVVLQTKKNENYFSKKNSKTTVISNPIDLGEMVGIAIKKEHEKKIVSVGRLISAKNQKMLINAFNIFHSKYSEYSLTIYGEGSERENLEKQIDELGLSESVSLPGTVKNVNELMSNAEIFVLSSDYEGMPNALIEAMCLGMPVISTMVSGATDLIKDGENGLLVDCGDTDALVQAMTKMAGDEDFRLVCAKNAVKTNELLRADKITNQWIETINRVKRV